MSENEEQKRKILRFLSEKYNESKNSFFSTDEVAQECTLDNTEVKRYCASLEEEGLIQRDDMDEKSKSYQVTLDGLILLESYSSSRSSGTGVGLSKFTESVKRGLDKIQMRNLELQAGVVEAGRKHKLMDGLYYVVLIDLSGSTIASSKMRGNTFSEWVKRFIQITKDAQNASKRNIAVHIKSIGDGSLFLFRNFDDILDWKNQVDKLCKHHNDLCKKEGKLDFHQYHHKTIIHLGEVYFDLENSDANAFGINVVFKIEKKFGKGEIGITDAVKQVLLQEINSGKFKIDSTSSYSLDETGDSIIPLWKLTVME